MEVNKYKVGKQIRGISRILTIHKSDYTLFKIHNSQQFRGRENCPLLFRRNQYD